MTMASISSWVIWLPAIGSCRQDFLRTGPACNSGWLIAGRSSCLTVARQSPSLWRMLNWSYHAFGQAWGPLRLFDSFFFLAGIGFAASALVTWALLPKLWRRLPTDRGRAFAVDAEKSVGKPVSAGLIFISIFCIAAMLFVPLTARPLLTVPFVL